MINVLLLPVLLGALIGVLVCALSKTWKRKPPIWPSFCGAFLIAISVLFDAFGFAVFTSRFWTDNVLFGPPVAQVICGLALVCFAPFFLASLIPSLIL